MKPKSDVNVDRIAFEKIKRIVPGFLAGNRDKNKDQISSDYSVRTLPEEI